MEHSILNMLNGILAKLSYTCSFILKKRRYHSITVVKILTILRLWYINLIEINNFQNI